MAAGYDGGGGREKSGGAEGGAAVGGGGSLVGVAERYCAGVGVWRKASAASAPKGVRLTGLQRRQSSESKRCAATDGNAERGNLCAAWTYCQRRGGKKVRPAAAALLRIGQDGLKIFVFENGISLGHPGTGFERRCLRRWRCIIRIGLVGLGRRRRNHVHRKRLSRRLTLVCALHCNPRHRAHAIAHGPAAADAPRRITRAKGWSAAYHSWAARLKDGARFARRQRGSAACRYGGRCDVVVAQQSPQLCFVRIGLGAQRGRARLNTLHAARPMHAAATS